MGSILLGYYYNSTCHHMSTQIGANHSIIIHTKYSVIINKVFQTSPLCFSQKVTVVVITVTSCCCIFFIFGIFLVFCLFFQLKCFVVEHGLGEAEVLLVLHGLVST